MIEHPEPIPDQQVNPEHQIADVPKAGNIALTNTIHDPRMQAEEPHPTHDMNAIEQLRSEGGLSPEDAAYLAEEEQKLGIERDFTRELDERLTAIAGINAAALRQREAVVDLAKTFGRWEASQIRRHRGDRTHELATIKDLNRYQVSFANLLSQVDDPKQRDEMVRKAYKERKGKSGAEQYQSFIEGTVVETVVGEEIKAVVDKLNVDGIEATFRHATETEDTKDGFDYVLQIRDEKTGGLTELRFDAKSRGAFRKAMSEDRGRRMLGTYTGLVTKKGNEVMLVNPTGFREDRNGNGDSIVKFHDLERGRSVPGFERDEHNQAKFRSELFNIIATRASLPISESPQP